MKRTSAFIFSIAMLCASGPAAYARTLVPIINHENVQWTSPAGQNSDLATIRERIVEAAKGRGWTVEAGSADNMLVATLVVRNKHSVKVAITYGTTAFSVRYLDSLNMNYRFEAPDTNAQPWEHSVKPAERQEVIHPNYNKWVGLLADAIRAQLQR